MKRKFGKFDKIYRPRPCALESCGKYFIPKSPNTKYCCPDHRDKDNEQENIVKERSRMCRKCGDIFVLQHPNERYCPECNIKIVVVYKSKIDIPEPVIRKLKLADYNPIPGEGIISHISPF